MVTLVWVVSMELTDQGDCWDDYSENNSIYIIVVPILSILMVRQSGPEWSTVTLVQILEILCSNWLNLTLLAPRSMT